MVSGACVLSKPIDRLTSILLRGTMDGMNKTMLLVGSVVLIVMAIAMVAVLNRTGSAATSSDVRARAAVGKTLQFNATVNTIDEAVGIVTVDNMYLADESRSGEPKSMGSWSVTAPAGFNFASLSEGMRIVIGIDPKTLLAKDHTVTALTITPAQ
jgi:hypothetical protein